jgi:hypothetical protein
MDRSPVYPGSHTDKQRVQDSGLSRIKEVGQVPMLEEFRQE